MISFFFQFVRDDRLQCTVIGGCSSLTSPKGNGEQCRPTLELGEPLSGQAELDTHLPSGNSTF